MSCQCRRNCPARALIGSGRECIIHERNALNPASALRAAGAVGVDVLQAFAHPARPGGLRPPLRRITLDLQLRVRGVGLVPGPQVLRAFERRVLPGLGLADLVDGLVGVFDDMELVDGSGRVGQVVADALCESQVHVARH